LTEFSHGDHTAVVGDLPSDEARERGFMPPGILLAGELIACAECRTCGWKSASSATAVIPESEEETRKTRIAIAILEFRRAPISCEETRLHLLASDVMES
jgi:hypothetical protein